MEELTDVDDPAWPAVASLVARSSTARVLGIDDVRARRVIFALQVTARSFLGALALHTGGILADHGWFRLLGGGSDLTDLATANGLSSPRTATASPPHLVVGFDALGGRFAVDGGGLGVRPGEVCYFGPDSLAWAGIGGGHADFVSAAIGGGLSDAFSSLRWTGWQDEISRLRPDQGLSLYPPPFTREGRDTAVVSRRAVPVEELFGFYDEAARRLGSGP